MASSTLRHVESQQQAFPEGQLVAVGPDRIVGAATSLVVHWEDHAEGESWRAVTGDGSFATHDPRASTLLCAELLAADARGPDVARSLYRTLRRLVRKLNLRRIVVAS